MRITRTVLPVAAALAAISLPAAAQSVGPGTTVERTTVTTTHSSQPYYHRSMPDPNADVVALHNQAVDLAHQATYAAQHGDRRQATILAGQAQELFNRAFTMCQEALH